MPLIKKQMDIVYILDGLKKQKSFYNVIDLDDKPDN
jgi:hypothetical protein